MKQSPTLLINHACSELGAALATAAAPRFRLALASDDRHRGNEACAALHREGCEALFLECQPGNTRDCQRGVERVLRRWGQLDSVINLPAFLSLGPFEATRSSDWEHLISAQLLDTVNLCQSAISAMRRQEQGGRILNVVPQFGLLPGPLSAAQSATSAAIVALGESLHSEVHHRGIHVSTLVLPLYQETPGFLHTSDPLTEARFQRKIARSPVTLPELGKALLEALDNDEVVQTASRHTHERWRRKRWFRKRWERTVRELGAKYRR